MEAQSLLPVSPRQSQPKEIIKNHVQMPLPCGINSLIPEILQADKEEIQSNKVVSQEERVEVRQRQTE